MAIATMDQLVAALAQSQNIDTLEGSMTTKGAGFYQSLWQATGRPGSGATPATGAGAVPTSATAGAIPFTNPTGSNTMYLAGLELSCTIPGVAIFYDRLVHTSGLSGTVATAQTVASTALTRYTTGVGVNLWLEFYSATGGTQVNCTISYTNQAGTSGQTTTFAFPVTTVAGQMFPVPLASGDSGVRAVASVTLSATTGTAGNFGITLAARLAQIPIISANYGVDRDYATLGMPQVVASACLTYAVLCTTTTSGTILSAITLAQG